MTREQFIAEIPTLTDEEFSALVEYLLFLRQRSRNVRTAYSYEALAHLYVDAAADYVSERKYEYSLVNLFNKPASEWQSLLSLLNSSDALMLGERYSLTHQDLKELYITWLSDPLVHERVGFCLIMFYSESMGCITTAIYNQARLLRKERSE